MNNLDIQKEIIQEERLEELEIYCDKAIVDIEFFAALQHLYVRQFGGVDYTDTFDDIEKVLQLLKDRTQSELCALTGGLSVIYREKYTENTNKKE